MILDVFLGFLLIISAAIGYKKGMFTVLIKLVGFILAIFLAYSFCGKLADYTYAKTQIGKSIEASVNQGIEQYVNSVLEKETVEGEEEKTEDNLITKVFELAGIKAEEEVENTAKELEEQEQEKTTVASSISKKFTRIILKVLSFIAIFLSVIIVAGILSIILGIICKLPILKSVNKLGGLIVNSLLFVAKIWIVLGIISFIAPVGWISPVIEYINNTIVAKWLYENNILAKIVFTTLK